MFEYSNLVAIDFYLLFYLFNSDTVHYFKMAYLKVRTDFYLIFKVCNHYQCKWLSNMLIYNCYELSCLTTIIFNIHDCFIG